MVLFYSTEPSLNCIDYSFQVLRESVYTAMLLDNDPETVETLQFVCMFDRFFDCLNVCNFTNGKLNRKIFQQPYRSSNDFRLKVWNMHSKCAFFLLSTNIILSFLLYFLESEFLVYLDSWEDSVSKRKGFEASERKRMLLSSETLLGLRITNESWYVHRCIISLVGQIYL